VGDAPYEKRIQLWVAADDPLGGGVGAIQRAYWQIWYPDGTNLSYDPQGTLVPATNCSLLGNATDPTTMLGAAVQDGEVSAAAVSDPNWGFIDRCQQSYKDFFYGNFPLSKHQPYGRYRIEAYVVSTGGVSSHLTNYIDVLPIISVVADFTTVTWTNLVNGVDQSISGNTVFNTSDGQPTLENLGNAGASIGITFSPMTPATGSGGPITGKVFDACFGLSSSELSCSGPPNTSVETANTITAGVEWDFPGKGVSAPTTSYDGDQTLCSDRTGKLDLSLQPPLGTPAGAYNGTLTIFSFASAVCKTDVGTVDPGTTLDPNTGQLSVTAAWATIPHANPGNTEPQFDASVGDTV